MITFGISVDSSVVIFDDVDVVSRGVVSLFGLEIFSFKTKINDVGDFVVDSVVGDDGRKVFELLAWFSDGLFSFLKNVGFIVCSSVWIFLVVVGDVNIKVVVFIIVDGDDGRVVDVDIVVFLDISIEISTFSPLFTAWIIKIKTKKDFANEWNKLLSILSVNRIFKQK